MRQRVVCHGMAWVSHSVCCCCRELLSQLTPSFLHMLLPVLLTPTSLPCAQYVARKQSRSAFDLGPQHVGFQQALHRSYVAPRRLPHAALFALAPGDWRAECSLQATARPAATRCHVTSKHVTEGKSRDRHAHAHAHETPDESKQMHTHMDTQSQKGELNREALRHLHQGKNEFLRRATAIERRQCTRLALPSLAALALFPCPLPPVLVPRIMHGQLSKTPPALGSRRRASRPQPLGLLSSCPPFSSSPAPVGHGRAGVGCEQAHGSVGAGFHWCHWCRCLSACRPCASHECVSVGDFEIALWVRRRWG